MKYCTAVLTMVTKFCEYNPELPAWPIFHLFIASEAEYRRETTLYHERCESLVLSPIVWDNSKIRFIRIRRLDQLLPVPIFPDDHGGGTSPAFSLTYSLFIFLIVIKIY